MVRQITSSTKFIALLTGAMLLLGFGFYVYFSYRTPKYPPSIPVYTEGQPTLGNKQAKVHIVTFEDPTCSTCRYYHDTVYPQLKRNYIDTGKVKYTVILVAFLPNSRPVAMSLFCAMSQMPHNFFTLLNLFYKEPISENMSPIAISQKIMTLAKDEDIDLDIADMQNCVATRAFSTKISENTSYAKDLMGGFIQTPTLYVNGMRLMNPSYKELVNYIDHAEKKIHKKKKS